MTNNLCIGLMSGTSMDGIDVALIETDGNEFIRPLANSFYPYHSSFKRILKQIEYLFKECSGSFKQVENNFNKILVAEPELMNLLAKFDIKSLNLKSVIELSTLLHQQAVIQLSKEHKIDLKQISLIGYHGQTMYHAPHAQQTLQIGDCQLLADHLQTPIVGHFRYNDIAHNGQGAPLTPIYHWARVKQEGLIPIAILNCGGIANVSFIVQEAETELLAFDTGPGSVLLDRFVRIKTQQQQFFDQDGLYSLAGTINQAAFAALMQQSLPENFLASPPPKSLDSYDCQLPEGFIDLSLEDGCATLTAFSAECMVRCLDFCLLPPCRWVLAGGGWHNPALLHQFKTRLETRFSSFSNQALQIITAQQLGWQQDMLEAEAFAYLAKRVEQNKPISFPGTTGVPQPLTGGEIFYPKIK